MPQLPLALSNFQANLARVYDINTDKGITNWWCVMNVQWGWMHVCIRVPSSHVALNDWPARKITMKCWCVKYDVLLTLLCHAVTTVS